ncbi:hypothetical protein Scep_004754 [Stephania cephalantha]|uniref:PWWP domain-containing protein n=1 Tax=Stephania cephalantha TaxID=152367 RepID=A0AAP0KTY3_9MAGN
MSSSFLDLNSDVASEPQIDVSCSRVSDMSSSSGVSREIRLSVLKDDEKQSGNIKNLCQKINTDINIEENEDPVGKIDSPRDGEQESIAQVDSEKENGTVEAEKGVDLDSFSKKQDNGAVESQHESPDTHLVMPETGSVKDRRGICGADSDEEGRFSVGDLVWGKVKSHPWWPGQIFDPSDASEQAMRYHKKDRYLVAYFGDQTFAWNEASSLKPFRMHFSEMEKQGSLEPFRGAVESALDEVSRLAELGLSCSCTPEEVRAEIRLPFVCNSGIREDVCSRDGEGGSWGVASFEPDKLVKYVMASAQRPCSGGDLLEFVLAKAQLTAFYQWKGYFGLPEFHVRGGLFENDAEYTSAIMKHNEQMSSGKRKMKKRYNSFRRTCEHILEDDMNPARKKRSLSELMGGNDSSVVDINDLSPEERNAGTSASASSGNKRRHLRSRELDAISSNLRSIKVGERFSKIATRLTKSHPPLSNSGEKFQKTAVRNDQSNAELCEADGSARSRKKLPRRRGNTGIKHSSPDDMLSQLCLAARDPMKGGSSWNAVVDFFTDYRNLITEDSSNSLTETSNDESLDGNGEPSKYRIKPQGTCNYRSVNECYLSEENIQSGQEEQKSTKTRKRKKSHLYEIPADKDGSSLEAECFLESKPSLQSEDRLTVEPESSLKQHKASSEKQSPDGNGNLVTEKKVGQLNEKDVVDISPTALILNFTEANAIPSERDLNEIFSRFGTLSKSETEVAKKKKRAKVVFQSRNDAEAAFSSAGKFSTFGPALISYQLTYLPSKPSPRATRRSRRNAASSEGHTI